MVQTTATFSERVRNIGFDAPAPRIRTSAVMDGAAGARACTRRLRVGPQCRLWPAARAGRWPHQIPDKQWRAHSRSNGMPPGEALDCHNEAVPRSAMEKRLHSLERRKA